MIKEADIKQTKANEKAILKQYRGLERKAGRSPIDIRSPFLNDMPKAPKYENRVEDAMIQSIGSAISQEVQSSLNSSAESFNLAFQNLDLRNTKAQQLVDQAQLNIEALKTTTGQLDQKYTSLMKSKMGLEKQISLVKHSSDEMIAQFGTYKQTVAGQLETISVLQQDASTIKQSISQLKIDSSGTKAQISQLEQTQNQVKQTILDQITGYHSEQQQLADRIALMVEKGDVIARLNIEAGKTLIQNNKIFLDADTVYFSGKAFIPMAKIKDLAVTNAKLGNISADKITFGELNGAKARITNIDAANISSGFLDNQRIRSNSITADKLAVNAIQDGFNNYSQNLKIDPYTLSFFNKNQLSGKLTSEGMEFWHGTRKIGRIGENSKIGNETIRGIAMNLEHEGDYISWSYRKAQNDSAFTSMLMLDPRGKFSGKAGIHMDADVHMVKVKPGIPSAREFLRFGVVNYNNTFYSALLNDSGKSGVMFGSGYLYLLHNNVVLPVEDIRNIVRALKGLGTLQLPTSIRTSGQGSGTVASFKTVKL
ncbi:hypothetical protein [Enterococcus gallinarum]|uniref:hypothetical protein n=1 Tax=Enterococcus gallinarum TaxID=1353 RepID=UPI00289254D3|nr:hypothetical protein [Enterococcus gallinarum]MDT2681339.1 hypothetical protein [Enterococcus gallinarum]